MKRTCALLVVMATLLLSGCQEGKLKADTTPSVEQVEAKVDTTIKDTMEAFYERMRQWRVLHGGMSSWESDK
ncbi:MAG: hypothetical protein IJK78_15930 [Bacteroidales bacterium]|nr:hypothetical protein [Bacteroidales bacterium]